MSQEAGRRIWYGKEMEGRHAGEPTIFIEAERLDNVQDLLKKIQDLPIKRLYFGAGKKDITSYAPRFFGHLKAKGYEIIIETSCRNVLLDKLVKVGASEVIVRLDLEKPLISTKITFKSDNGREAVIYCPDTKTPLDGVFDGLYSNEDKML